MNNKLIEWRQILLICIGFLISVGCSEDKANGLIFSIYSEILIGDSLENVSASLDKKGVKYHLEQSSLDKKVLSQLNYSNEELASIEEKLIVINEGTDTLTLHFSVTNKLIKVMLIRK